MLIKLYCYLLFLLNISIAISLPQEGQLLDCAKLSDYSSCQKFNSNRSNNLDSNIVVSGVNSKNNCNNKDESSIVCGPPNEMADFQSPSKAPQVQVYIKIISNANQLELGSDLTIECRFNTSLNQDFKFKLRWLRSVTSSSGFNQSISLPEPDSSTTVIAATLRLWTVQRNGGIDLKLNDFQEADAGDYFCQAVTLNDTSDSSIISEARIQLMHKGHNLDESSDLLENSISYYSEENLSKLLPSLVVLPEFCEANKGETIYLICTTSSLDPDPEETHIKWTFESSERSSLHQRAPVAYEHLPINVSQHGNTLIIWSMTDEQSGFYRCSMNLAEFNLTVEALGEVNLVSQPDSAPLVFVTPELVRISPNGSATVQCEATGYPAPSANWYRVDGTQLIDLLVSTDANSTFVLDPETIRVEQISYKDSVAYCNQQRCKSPSHSKVNAISLLHIGPAQANHQAQYVCRAVNKHGSNQASTVVDVDYKEPPIVNITPVTEQIVTLTSNGPNEESQNVTFKCSIQSGRPKPRLRWLRISNSNGLGKDKGKLSSVENLDIYDLTKTSRAGSNVTTSLEENGSSLSLVIGNISLDDEGDYICLGENEWARHTAIAHLTTKKPVSVKISQSSPLLMRLNESFHLDCIATGHPLPLDIEWSRTDRGAFFSLISRTSNAVLGHQERAVLKFDRVTKDDSGEYTCNARDSSNSSLILRDTIMVLVEDLDVKSTSFAANSLQNSLMPKLMVRPTKVTALVGSNITLDCLAVSGLQPTIVEWIGPPMLSESLLANNSNILSPQVLPYYRSNVASSSASGQMLQLGSKLKIIGLSRAHEGIYQCKGRNQVGAENAAALIKILDTDQSDLQPNEHDIQTSISTNRNAINQAKTKVAKIGSNIELKCQVNGIEQPVTSWSRDGLELPQTSVQIGDNLWIQNVSAKDDGLYVCSARPKQPSKVIQAKIKLLVRGNSDQLVNKLSQNLQAKIVASKSTVNLGESITLECIISVRNHSRSALNDDLGPYLNNVDELIDEMERNVIWTNLHSGQSLFQDNVYIQNNLLIIYELKPENSATYRCNYNDLSQNSDYKLQVHDINGNLIPDQRMQVTRPISNLNQAQLIATNGRKVELRQASLGSQLQIDCPILNPYWTRGDNWTKKVAKGSLVFDSIDTSQADVYHCHGELDELISFIVQVLVPVARFVQKPVSFITLPTISGANDQLDLELKFLPERDTGLILFNGHQQQQASNNRSQTGGSGDYILLGLNKGYLEFRFELGDGVTVLRSLQSLAINQWHEVVIERNRRGAVMWIDKQPPISNSSAGKFFNLNLDSVLYVGGNQYFLNKTNRRPFHGFTRGFQGCISLLRISQSELNLMARNRSVSVGIYECDKSECQYRCHQTDGLCQIDRSWWKPTLAGSVGHNKLDPTRRASGADDMRCICLPGYTGIHCEQNITTTGQSNNSSQFAAPITAPPAKVEPKLNGACETMKPCSTIGALKCQSYSSTSFKCHCNMGFMGPSCNQTAIFGSETSVGFNSQAHLQIRFNKAEENAQKPEDFQQKQSNESTILDLTNLTKMFSIADNMNISFKLQTKSSYGLILYTGQPLNNLQSTTMDGNRQVSSHHHHQNSKSMVANLLARLSHSVFDYLAIALLDGHVELSYELGSGVAIIRSTQRINDGAEHQIRIIRSGKWAKLIIDEQHKQEGQSPGKLSVLNTEPDIYLGGLPHLMDPSSNVVVSTTHLSSFIGCLSQLQINSLGPLNLIHTNPLIQVIESCNLIPCSSLPTTIGAITTPTTSSKPRPYQSPTSADGDDPDEM